MDLLNIAKLSYEEPHIFKKEYPNAIFYEGSKEDWQFYFIINDLEVIIAYRGSESKSDFYVDADFFLDPVPKEICSTGKAGKVHGGFRRQFMDSLESLKICLKFIPSYLPIRVVGHSLGGALATLCSISLKVGALRELFDCDRMVTCITFGSPRVGNSDLVKVFDSNVDKSIRCVNCDDIVTMRPYWGYDHVKGLYSIGKSSRFYSYFGRVRDHYLKSYEDSLKPLNHS
jgi:predicted lipase